MQRKCDFYLGPSPILDRAGVQASKKFHAPDAHVGAIATNEQQNPEKLMAETVHEDSPLAPTVNPIPPNDRRRARAAGCPTRRLSPIAGDMVTRTRSRPPIECIALLLQGGGALGAYQAGVYEALAEADLHPDWIAGISIGAINGALIVGNAPELRVARQHGGALARRLPRRHSHLAPSGSARAPRQSRRRLHFRPFPRRLRIERA